MVMYEQDSDVIQWGLRILEGDPPYYSPGYYGGEAYNPNPHPHDVNYMRDDDDDDDGDGDGDDDGVDYDIADCSHVESDEMIARTLQEEFQQLAVTEANVYGDQQQHLHHQQSSIDDVNDWHCTETRNYCSEQEYGHEESDDAVASSSCSSPGGGEEYTYATEFTDEYELDDEVGKRLTQLVPIPHVPRINGEIPSIDEATSDHERLLNRLLVFGFVELRVQGDGNCQFRALSDQLYGTPDWHKSVRRRLVNQLKSNPDIYEGYVPMEYGDYLRKMSRSGKWGDHVTLQAAADSYGVKILVMTSFKDTCYIEILPNTQKPKGVIFLSFWAEVHYNSIYFQGDISSEIRKKKKWWNFGNKH